MRSRDFYRRGVRLLEKFFVCRRMVSGCLRWGGVVNVRERSSYFGGRFEGREWGKFISLVSVFCIGGCALEKSFMGIVGVGKYLARIRVCLVLEGL